MPGFSVIAFGSFLLHLQTRRSSEDWFCTVSEASTGNLEGFIKSYIIKLIYFALYVDEYLCTSCGLVLYEHLPSLVPLEKYTSGKFMTLASIPGRGASRL